MVILTKQKKKNGSRTKSKSKSKTKSGNRNMKKSFKTRKNVREKGINSLKGGAGKPRKIKFDLVKSNSGSPHKRKLSFTGTGAVQGLKNKFDSQSVNTTPKSVFVKPQGIESVFSQAKRGLNPYINVSPHIVPNPLKLNPSITQIFGTKFVNQKQVIPQETIASAIANQVEKSGVTPPNPYLNTTVKPQPTANLSSELKTTKLELETVPKTTMNNAIEFAKRRMIQKQKQINKVIDPKILQEEYEKDIAGFIKRRLTSDPNAKKIVYSNEPNSASTSGNVASGKKTPLEAVKAQRIYSEIKDPIYATIPNTVGVSNPIYNLASPEPKLENPYQRLTRQSIPKKQEGNYATLSRTNLNINKKPIAASVYERLKHLQEKTIPFSKQNKPEGNYDRLNRSTTTNTSTLTRVE